MFVYENYAKEYVKDLGGGENSVQKVRSLPEWRKPAGKRLPEFVWIHWISSIK